MTERPGYPCPCCGYRTLPGPSPTDDICSICFWQDDFVDNQDTNDPNQVGRVISQDPSGQADKGSTVTIVVGQAPAAARSTTTSTTA